MANQNNAKKITVVLPAAENGPGLLLLQKLPL